MFRTSMVLAALSLVACEDGGGGDTGLTDTATGCAVPYDGPISIEGTPTVACQSNGDVMFTVDTVGVPSEVSIYSEETANNQPFSDEHTLNLATSDACGEEATFEQTIATVSSDPAATAYSMNESTLFSCAPAMHYRDGTGVMTYGIRVYDADGNLADCVIGGEDPNVFINGEFAGATTPSAPAEFADAACSVGTINSY